MQTSYLKIWILTLLQNKDKSLYLFCLLDPNARVGWKNKNRVAECLYMILVFALHSPIYNSTLPCNRHSTSETAMRILCSELGA